MKITLDLFSIVLIAAIVIIPVTVLINFIYFSYRYRLMVEKDMYINKLKYMDDVGIKIDGVIIDLKVVLVNHYCKTIKAFKNGTNCIVITSFDNVIYKRNGKANSCKS